MIPALFVFELKSLLRRLLGLLVFALVMGLLGVWLYQPEMQAQLRLFSEELPLLTRLLGYGGSANLPVHLMGLQSGFLLPVIFTLSAHALSLRLIARPLGDGRMAQRLAAPHRRAAVLMTLFWLLALEALLICLAVLLGQAAGVFIFLGGQADFPALIRLALGLMLSALPVAGGMTWVAAASPGPASARRLGGFLGLLFVGFMMASRLTGWPRWLGYLTPFSLFKGQELITRPGALMLCALGLPLGLLLAGLGAWAFSRRDV